MQLCAPAVASIGLLMISLGQIAARVLLCPPYITGEKKRTSLPPLTAGALSGQSGSHSSKVTSNVMQIGFPPGTKGPP